jgi:hypothetical protein
MKVILNLFQDPVPKNNVKNAALYSLGLPQRVLHDFVDYFRKFHFICTFSWR